MLYYVNGLYLPILFISVKTIKEETTSSLFHFWFKEKGMDSKVQPTACVFLEMV